MYLITCLVGMLCSMHLVRGSDDHEFIQEVIHHHNHRVSEKGSLPDISLYDFKAGILDALEDLTLFYNLNLSYIPSLHSVDTSSNTGVLSSFVCNRKERQFTAIKNNKAEVCCANLVGKSRGCNKYDCKKGSRKRMQDSNKSNCCESGLSTFCPGTTKATAERSSLIPSCSKSERYHDINPQKGSMRFCCQGGSCSRNFGCPTVIKKTHRSTNRFFYCCETSMPGTGMLSLFCQNEASPQPVPIQPTSSPFRTTGRPYKKPYGGNNVGGGNGGGRCPYTRAQVLNQFDRMTTTFKEISSEVKKQNEERALKEGQGEDPEQRAAISRFLATVPNQIMRTLTIFTQSAAKIG